MEFDINEYCGVKVDPGKENTATIEQGPGITTGPKMVIPSNSWLRVSGNWELAGWLRNSNGEFALTAGSTAVIHGIDGSTQAYLQYSGLTQLYAGARLSVIAGKTIAIDGGTVSISYVSGGPANFSATIKASTFILNGGDIVTGVNSTGDNHRFGTFVVIGDVLWSDGTYRPFVSAAFESDSDTWQITGRLLVRGTAAIAPVAVDGENNPVTPPDAMVWESLRVDKGIITVPAGAPSVLTGWDLDKVNDKRWRVKKA
jgi:hypothetical protein